MLYLEDNYKKEFQTSIIKTIENKIFLKETFFYARSGGQPGDQGTITIENKKLNVIDTVKEEGLFAHIVDQEVNISEGTLISAKILWEKRHRHMRMHTTMHLLCAALPYYVTGGSIGLEKSRIDFDLGEETFEFDISTFTVFLYYDIKFWWWVFIDLLLF